MFTRIQQLISKIRFGGNLVPGKIILDSLTDYNAINAIQALDYCDVVGKKVLVVGCNKGKDCTYFIRAGAARVVGLDVIPDTGRDFQHKRVKYVVASAENMPISDNTFDFIYCFATLEHIPDIKSAFEEMVRVCKIGGVIVTVAAPLWNSAYGHHKKDMFENYPWIHLLLSKDKIKQWFKENMANKFPVGYDYDWHINYMMDISNMNQKPAAEYLQICDSLKVTKKVLNMIEKDNSIDLPQNDKEKLLSLYTTDELKGMTHRFVGIK